MVDPTTYPTLYKRGVKGEIRVWFMQFMQDGDIGHHRVVSGIKDGALTESGWTTCEAKNVGRKNATTSVEQAQSEIDNLYKIRQDRGYFLDETKIDDVPFTKPMLAVDWEKRKDKVDIGEAYAQPKLDGIRCIARVDGLWTRTGKPIVAVPHIMEALAPIFEERPDIVFDGELYNHEYKDNFNSITSAVRKTKPKPEDFEAAKVIQYHVYDIVDNEMTFWERFSLYFELLEYPLDADETEWALVSPHIVPVKTFDAWSPDILDEMYYDWISDGYEGQMIRLNSPYENKRSNNLLKRKDFITEEFPVIAMEEGKGNWAGCVKRFVVQLPNGNTNEATPRGTQEALRNLLENGNTPDWATVRYFGYTPDGQLRFPIAVDYGWGKRTD